MKKVLNIGFLMLSLGLFLVSCNDDEYQTVESIDKIKIDSVKVVSDTMDVLGIQSIKTYSTYPSNCEGFYGYDYVYNDNLQRQVTAYKYITNGPCAQKNTVGASQINFNPQKKGTYTFKFWNGGDNWITKTIVVQ
ncbi:hypothetical protein C1637_21530 [Chryseobacterium lactis]|uniref:DUF4625 domain-containing protein n=1 Tax=Chryseobacterium lactis TaxID=1241981 RepID=A0A3G6RNP2_CHRLC|nr:hypothetical protein [Chryseobacterium lactis]AZA83349.1 hypothetical protein EG342_16330 [Chryseobacterium lactis]AZB03734.1 hypothetical protein EG341_07205 [Chryseobacterium lactis]PNW11690.1 hypothetical protein C1637_21530 [Chryseobacterium lactis]